jgi:hypothetical protein
MKSQLSSLSLNISQSLGELEQHLYDFHLCDESIPKVPKLPKCIGAASDCIVVNSRTHDIGGMSWD